MHALATAHTPARTPTRDLILDAAERRFAEHGFDPASVREIASDAGLKNQASLYHYFISKRALYEAVLERAVHSIIGLAAEPPAPLDPQAENAAQAPGDYLDAVIDYLLTHPHVARLIQGAGMDESAFVREIVPRLLEPLSAQGLRMLAGAPNRWPAEELPHLAAALYHLIFGYFANPTLMRVLLERDARTPDAVARQRRFVKRAVSLLIGSDAG